MHEGTCYLLFVFRNKVPVVVGTSEISFNIIYGVTIIIIVKVDTIVVE